MMSDSEPTTKLPPEVKAAWLTALRSGEYKQGRQMLYNAGDDSYCCLGVLCKVLDVPWIDGSPGSIETMWEGFSTSFISGGKHVPYPVRYAMSRPIVHPVMKTKATAEAVLANMNDNGQSFEQIAEFIEKEL